MVPVLEVRRAVRPLIATGCLVAVVAARPAQAATLDAADARITFTAPAACRVDIAFTIATPSALAVEHRLLVDDAERVEEVSVAGGGAAADAPTRRGGARMLIVRVPGRGRHTYRLGYRVVRPAAARHRCPLWLPTVPTQGRDRRITLTVALPDGAAPLAGAFPRLAWHDGTGSAVLAHLPAFVRVPFAVPGEPPPSLAASLGVDRVVEIVTVGLLGAATAIWFRMRRRR